MTQETLENEAKKCRNLNRAFDNACFYCKYEFKAEICSQIRDINDTVYYQLDDINKMEEIE